MNTRNKDAVLWLCVDNGKKFKSVVDAAEWVHKEKGTSVDYRGYRFDGVYKAIMGMAVGRIKRSGYFDYTFEQIAYTGKVILHESAYEEDGMTVFEYD